MVAKEERDKLGKLLRRTVHRYRSAIGASVYSFIIVYQQKSFSSESPKFHNSVLLKLIAVINQAPRHYTLSAHSIYLITIAAARIILPPTRTGPDKQMKLLAILKRFAPISTNKTVAR